jgi:hypothetical protein
LEVLESHLIPRLGICRKKGKKASTEKKCFTICKFHVIKDWMFSLEARRLYWNFEVPRGGLKDIYTLTQLFLLSNPGGNLKVP